MNLDIERFLDRSRAVETGDLDWALAARQGLSELEAAALRYMADTENNTILYLRRVLAGHTTRNYELIAFLACWLYEETHHGRAIDRFLAACGYAQARPRYEEVVATTGASQRIAGALTRTAAVLTPHFTAVHMAWGAISEMFAAASYTQLARRTENTELRRLLLRVAQDERRHQTFYYEQARRRLEASRFAQRLTRFGLGRFWTPVGDGVGGEDGDPGIVGALLHDNAWSRREWDRIDAMMGRLPGLAGFDLSRRRALETIAAFKQKRPALAQAIREDNAAIGGRFTPLD
ncbi:MAG: acyl-ACP desaturase [Myxococcales bacterium]|nr:acyl-ACP desaturase [Myxococcales bacterium]